ncbi:hypothetical protein ES703_109426 [subsurface metagenome]
MEVRVQCFDQFMDNANHVISEKEKIINYIKQKKIKKYGLYKTKILSKILRDELKIDSVEFIYKNINKILGLASLTPLYFSSVGLFISYIVNLFINLSLANLYLLLFVISIPLNLLVMILINYIGGKKFAYQI